MQKLFQNLCGLIDRAGRLAYLEMHPVDGLEVAADRLDRLWLRDSFPDDFWASDDRASLHWRQDFIRTYLERDIPQFGPRIAARDASPLLDNAGTSSARPVERRRPRPFARGQCWQAAGQIAKIHVRDSGSTHALLGLGTRGKLLGHPIAAAPQGNEAHFYRTSAGAEIDLLLTPPGGRRWQSRSSAA